jgi:hypothetical protein
VTGWLEIPDVPGTVVRVSRSSARGVTLRATEVALERRPDLAVTVVRAALERSARRYAADGVRSRVLLLRLTLRAMDAHPVVARAMVRSAVRRARTAQLAPDEA